MIKIHDENRIMNDIKTSSFPSCRNWIKQFRPEDRIDARNLIDELIYIETSCVIDELTSEIKKIIRDENKVSIIPVREVFDNEESYYDLIDKKLNPKTNISDEPLGSEAIISNLITRLRRGYGKSVVLEYNKTTKSNKSPSIFHMREEKVKALILVDDVIGSGKRTVEFFNFLYKNKTIKSWVSSGSLKVYIVCYMATKKGLNFVNKNIKKDLVEIISINNCPTFYDSYNSDKISELCERYANINEKKPLGFKSSFVKVIFEHSAPNNIPTILHKNVTQYKPNDTDLLNMPENWVALFPNRYIQSSFSRDMSISRSGISMKSDIKNLLHVMICIEKSNLESLVKLTKIQKIKLKHYLKFCDELDILNVNGNTVKITGRSKRELQALTNDKKVVDINKEFYYPIR